MPGQRPACRTIVVDDAGSALLRTFNWTRAPRRSKHEHRAQDRAPDRDLDGPRGVLFGLGESHPILPLGLLLAAF